MNYGGNLRNTPENLMFMAAAEDTAVIGELIANKDNRILDYAHFRGALDPASTPDRLLYFNQEYRPPFYGHVSFINMKNHLISPFTTGYEGTAIESLYPSNTDMFRLPPGRMRVEAVKGFEYRPAAREVTIQADSVTSATLPLVRLANLARQGWYSGSNHVHMNYGGNLRNTPENLMFMAAAEDTAVIGELIANKDNRILDYAHFRGALDPASTPDRLLYFNQEYRPPFYAHVSFINLKEHLISPFTTGYEGTAIESLYPSNTDMFRKLPPRLVQREQPRAHELRRQLAQHPGKLDVHGRGRGYGCYRRAHRQQRQPHFGLRPLSGRPGPGLDPGSASLFQPRVSPAFLRPCLLHQHEESPHLAFYDRL